jgi:hypothetical protein
MFLHAENQQLLWQTLQKSPYLVEFTQKFAGHREEWFLGIIEQFYTQWISQNNPLPSNARELLEINKLALQTMVADLKRVLGYNGSSSPHQIIQPHAEPNTYDIRPYDVAAERKLREDTFSANFNKYQSEYNSLLKQPELPIKAIPAQSGGEKIKNMEELLKEQARLRDIDMQTYASASSQQQPPATKLKIMGEIDNMEMIIEEPRRAVRFLSIPALTTNGNQEDNPNDNTNEISSISQ